MKTNKKTVAVIILVAIVLVASGIRIYSGNKAKFKEFDMGKVAKSDLTQSISVTGNVEARDNEAITLSSLQKVTDVLVTEGQLVKKGDILAKVDITDSEYQLKKAQMNYDLAKLSLTKIVNQKGDKVSLENAVKQAEIGLENAQSSFDTAKQSFTENETLFQNEVISQTEYDASKKAMDSAENQLRLSQIQLENAQNTLNDFGKNHNDQVAQQSKQLESAKADIDNLKTKVDNGMVKAGIDGKIVKLNIKTNQYPTQDSDTISIYDLSQYRVLIQVSQYDAVSISKGQKTIIKIKGLDKEYNGTVAKVGEAAEVVLSGTNKETKVNVEVIIDNPDEKIKAGYEADADIILKQSQDTLAVNFEAIMTDKDGKKYVFVVEKNKAVKRIIEIGLETDFDAQILSGLKEGENYITNPSSTLKDGDLVKASGGKKSDNKN